MIQDDRRRIGHADRPDRRASGRADGGAFSSPPLLEEDHHLDDGIELVRAPDWREFRPADPTSAKRIQRFRQRK